jgi:hypothetical protein
MTKPPGGNWWVYYMVAFYLGSRVRTGDLEIRFGVAIVLFFVIPVLVQRVQHRLELPVKG